MQRATDADRRHFQRIRLASQNLDPQQPPASLAEMFDRLETLQRQLGNLTEAGQHGPDDGDLQSHLRHIAHLRALDPTYGT